MMLAESGDMVGRMSDLLARRVREKHIRPGEAGEGCDARLGVRRYIGSPSRGKWVTYLDTGYTNDSDPVYKSGTWWGRRSGGYQGSPRYRDIRRGRGLSSGHFTAEPFFDRRLSESTKYAFRKDSGKSTPRRDTYHPLLPPGSHTVLRYCCGGRARVGAD
jgi:hypothetical protein